MSSTQSPDQDHRWQQVSTGGAILGVGIGILWFVVDPGFEALLVIVTGVITAAQYRVKNKGGRALLFLALAASFLVIGLVVLLTQGTEVSKQQVPTAASVLGTTGPASGQAGVPSTNSELCVALPSLEAKLEQRVEETVFPRNLLLLYTFFATGMGLILWAARAFIEHGCADARDRRRLFVLGGAAALSFMTYFAYDGLSKATRFDPSYAIARSDFDRPPPAVEQSYFGYDYAGMREDLTRAFLTGYESQGPRELLRLGVWRGISSSLEGEMIFRDATGALGISDEAVLTRSEALLSCAVEDLNWSLNQVPIFSPTAASEVGRVHFFIGRANHILATISAIRGESVLADDYYRQAIGAYTLANGKGCGYDCQSVAIYRRGEARLQLGIGDAAAEDFCACRSPRSGLHEEPRAVCEEYLREMGFDLGRCQANR